MKGLWFSRSVLAEMSSRSASVSVRSERRRAAGTIPPVLCQHKLNRHMAFAEGPPNLMQRLSRLPAAPHVGPLDRGKSYPSRIRYKHHFFFRENIYSRWRCIDRLSWRAFSGVSIPKRLPGFFPFLPKLLLFSGSES
jgi:hypothetical protein